MVKSFGAGSFRINSNSCSFESRQTRNTNVLRVARNKKCAFACSGLSGLSGPRFRLSGPVSVVSGHVSGLSGLKPLFGRARALTPVKALRILIES